MGWMSWATFFCEVDCEKHPHACINEKLYQEMADKLDYTLPKCSEFTENRCI
ncbi:unnamed protein product [Cylicostephanus goldi]|uniref:Uncharacterized protein n=1 Tax=Cylicostephanus goldi TaxID=71465 RepID=A0A3P6R1K0_CYLGO|nr:unnamed protein product [Cylicostephanus goldi]